MKVILLKGVQKLGNKLDIVTVSDGFAMNSLFPQKLAELATPDAIKRAEKLRSFEDAAKQVRRETWTDRRKRNCHAVKIRGVPPSCRMRYLGKSRVHLP